MSCAAPGPALGLDATVAGTRKISYKNSRPGFFSAEPLVEYGPLKFISKIMTENSVKSTHHLLRIMGI